MNRIKDLREKMGIGQKALAAELKVSQPTVSDWEAGRKVPSSKSAARLADFFKVSMDYMLGRDDVIEYNEIKKIPANQTDDGFADRLAAFISLTPEQQKQALEVYHHYIVEKYEQNKEQ